MLHYFNSAVEASLQFANMQPNNINAHLLVSQCATLAGQPNIVAQAHLTIGSILLNQNPMLATQHFNPAVEASLQFANMQPNNINAHLLVSQCATLANRLDIVAQAHLAIGNIHLNQQSLQAAGQAFVLCLHVCKQIQLTDIGLLKQLQRLLIQSGQEEKAIECLQIIHKVETPTMQLSSTNKEDKQYKPPGNSL